MGVSPAAIDVLVVHTFFATSAPGVESILHAEIKELKLARSERQVGGVRFEGTLEDAWRANLGLRTAVRVLLRLARFQAADADALYDTVAKIDWLSIVRPDGTLLVSAQTKESRLEHSEFVEQRTKDAIVDAFRARTGVRPSVDKDDPDLRVHVHLYRDRATLSLDTSGESLHKRGWRRAQGPAPLAETLAAAMVLRSGWDRRAPLLDPFCGSGTIPIEAALYACGTPPGIFRDRFGFERWLGHDRERYAEFKRSLSEGRQRPRRLQLLGSDLEPRQIEAARANAEGADVAEVVSFEIADARDFAPRRGWNAWIVTNPPYGRRVGSPAQLQELYRTFGSRLREHGAGCRLALLAGNPGLVRTLNLGRHERVHIVHGGLACELVLAELTRTGGP